MYYLLDTELNLICPIEIYENMIWTNRYNDNGDFELYLRASDDVINLLKKDYYITRDDDFTQCMIIENIKIDTDIENGNHITVTGRNLKSILDRRIIWKQTTFSGTVEVLIRKLITENAINPTITARKINHLILGAELGITEMISVQYTGDNLGERIREICKSYNIGYDILLDLDEKQFIFVLYQGTDRSYNQNENPFVVFSDEFENLLTTNYSNNTENYKNVALVAGEGEGKSRKTATIGTASGLQRYELFVDARDVSSDTETTITDAQYTALLTERGKEKLSETVITETIEGDVAVNHTFKYGTDYFLGDTIQLINEYGIAMTPQVVEVIENDGADGKSMVIGFTTDANTEV